MANQTKETKKIAVPQQATFTANTPADLDEKVNEWLKRRALKGGNAPQLGKAFSTYIPDGNNTGSRMEYGVVFYWFDLEEVKEGILAVTG